MDIEQRHERLIAAWKADEADDGTDYERAIELGETVDEALDAYCTEYLRASGDWS